MGFANSILAGEQLVRTGIRSENYVAGVAGWRIGRDGSAEVLEALIRGSLITGVGDPRIEVIPDDGFGNPVIWFYPDGGGPPASIQLDIGASLLLHSGGGAGVDIDDAGHVQLLTTDLGIGAGPGLAIHLDDAPVADVGGGPCDLITLHDQVSGSPAAADDTTNAVFTNWGPALAVTCPTWASRAIIDLDVTGAFGITAITDVEFRMTLNGVAGRTIRQDNTDIANAPRLGWGWCDELAPGATGAMNLRVQASRIFGGGAWRVDATSDFCAHLVWLP